MSRPCQLPALPGDRTIRLKDDSDTVSDALNHGREDGATGRLHQDRVISLHDCEVVIHTGGLVLYVHILHLNLNCISFWYMDSLSSIVRVRIVRWIVCGGHLS